MGEEDQGRLGRRDRRRQAGEARASPGEGLEHLCRDARRGEDVGAIARRSGLAAGRVASSGPVPGAGWVDARDSDQGAQVLDALGGGKVPVDRGAAARHAAQRKLWAVARPLSGSACDVERCAAA